MLVGSENVRFQDLYKFKPPNKEIWVSVLVYCPYKAYLLNTIPRREPKNAFSLAGIFVHQLLQNDFEDYDSEVRVELPLEDGWKLIGRVDLFDQFSNRVIEIKTGEDPKLKEEWIKQTNLYAYLLNCDAFEIWLVNIRNGEIEMREFETDIEEAKKLIDMANRVIKGEQIRRDGGCYKCIYEDVCFID